MNTFSLRATIISFVAILLAGSFFAVLLAEENKRLAKNVAERERFLEDIQNINQERQSYLDAIAKSKADSQQSMNAAKQQYDELIEKQPALIQDNQKQSTVIVKEQVPVTTTVPATTTKPKSTRTTKTS